MSIRSSQGSETAVCQPEACMISVTYQLLQEPALLLPARLHSPTTATAHSFTECKSLRLHKYAALFSQMTYEEMMALTECQLEAQSPLGVGRQAESRNMKVRASGVKGITSAHSKVPGSREESVEFPMRSNI
ncbi:hypothetical protein P7K49_018082 [Saguinus oedipus]|uniref:Uncharacterized protein n=1 Tax=Saguinus oedipus TaxID=9490 RepID=A0ABQ9V527_SAGOE|nr:hypothetical protein P7K49_018082 [Saguinus oedipus]